jgi:secreted trypsin-like serine protease
MKKAIAAVTALLAAVVTASAFAITNGQFDGEAHPNVAAFLWDGNHDGVKTHLCTASLIAPRVLVTASHCTEFADRFQSEVWVTFDSTDVEDDPTGVLHGHTVTNPKYDSKQLYANDVSLIVLDEPVVGITPVTIAPVGLLDRMKADRSAYSAAFLNVGYGTHEQAIVKKVGPVYPWSGDREFSTSAFAALDKVFVHLNQSLAQGYGGTGYGDSGGPTFVDTASGPVQVSTVSTGDVALYATSVNTRLDRQEVHDFIAPYLNLP